MKIICQLLQLLYTVGTKIQARNLYNICSTLKLHTVYDNIISDVIICLLEKNLINMLVHIFLLNCL